MQVGESEEWAWELGKGVRVLGCGVLYVLVGVGLRGGCNYHNAGNVRFVSVHPTVDQLYLHDGAVDTDLWG